jgi:hypothetical protein
MTSNQPAGVKQKEVCLLCSLDLLFGPEDGGSTFLEMSVNLYWDTRRHIIEDSSHETTVLFLCTSISESPGKAVNHQNRNISNER